MVLGAPLVIVPLELFRNGFLRKSKPFDHKSIHAPADFLHQSARFRIQGVIKIK